MKVISGCLVIKENKILMVKEANLYVMESGIFQQDMSTKGKR